MQNGTIEKTIHIAAPREMVWDYLTKSEHLAKWFHRPDADFVDQQAFDMKGKDGGSLCSGAIEDLKAAVGRLLQNPIRPGWDSPQFTDVALQAASVGLKDPPPWWARARQALEEACGRI